MAKLLHILVAVATLACLLDEALGRRMSLRAKRKKVLRQMLEREARLRNDTLMQRLLYEESSKYQKDAANKPKYPSDYGDLSHYTLPPHVERHDNDSVDVSEWVREIVTDLTTKPTKRPKTSTLKRNRTTSKYKKKLAQRSPTTADPEALERLRNCTTLSFFDLTPPELIEDTIFPFPVEDLDPNYYTYKSKAWTTTKGEEKAEDEEAAAEEDEEEKEEEEEDEEAAEEDEEEKEEEEEEEGEAAAEEDEEEKEEDDDLQLYLPSSVDNISQAIHIMNQDLQQLHQWTVIHGILPNPKKFQCIIIGSIPLIDSLIELYNNNNNKKKKQQKKRKKKKEKEKKKRKKKKKQQQKKRKKKEKKKKKKKLQQKKRKKKKKKKKLQQKKTKKKRKKKRKKKKQQQKKHKKKKEKKKKN
ncbi:hypothetical protein M8J77_008529 [Diaphorina citri]|nr:hypothetical protein M8J77_008529 [Diaphorina citri]